MSYSEKVLGGRLVVNVSKGAQPPAPLISIGSRDNAAGSMTLTPLELAALLDGPLARALAEVNR